MAGAAFGFGMLWTSLVSLPLLIAVQLMCARVGLVSGRGLVSVLRRHYSRRLLWCACVVVLVANTIDLAADLGGMAEAAELLTGLPSFWFSPVFAAFILLLLLFASYRTMVRVFKGLALVLFAYIGAAFFANPSWSAVARATVLPDLSLDRAYLMTLVALFGSTISPFLFFWQAAQEVEEKKAMGKRSIGQRRGASGEELLAARTDVATGMLFSTVVSYFVILTTGATLHVAGQHDIQTAQQAARALRPLAGKEASVLFAVGLIGAGLLSVPVLAGSAAYAVAEAGGWRAGMDERPRLAKKFYAVIVVLMLTGMGLNYAGVNALKMLFWSAVLNGVLAPPFIVIILLICNNRRIMGEHMNGRLLNVLGLITAIVMSMATIALLTSWL